MAKYLVIAILGIYILLSVFEPRWINEFFNALSWLAQQNLPAGSQ
jgi:hypothetical protein